MGSGVHTVSAEQHPPRLGAHDGTGMLTEITLCTSVAEQVQ